MFTDVTGALHSPGDGVVDAGNAVDAGNTVDDDSVQTDNTSIMCPVYNSITLT